MNYQTSIYFVRHGEVHNPEDVFYGRLPRFQLSKRGRFQAQAVAYVLSDKSIAAIFSSPLLRARQTAEIILRPHRDLSLKVSRLLNEVHSPFDGHPRSELVARNWDVYTGVSSDYEQPVDILSRARRFLENVRNRYVGQSIVAVTHSDIILFLTLWFNGISATAENKWRINDLGLPKDYPAPASVVKLFYQTSETNEIPSLKYKAPTNKFEIIKEDT